jgi:hypothetical protein
MYLTTIKYKVQLKYNGRLAANMCACAGVVEGEARRVEAYLAGGGDPARALSAHEVALLDRASAFDCGHTLVHLAIRSFPRFRLSLTNEDSYSFLF